MSINKHSHAAGMLKLNWNQIFVFNSKQPKDIVPHCLRKENCKYCRSKYRINVNHNI